MVRDEIDHRGLFEVRDHRHPDPTLKPSNTRLETDLRTRSLGSRASSAQP
jgi:hypothetical protein